MASSRLGRPPLPEGQRKRTITVYLGASIVDRIDHRAVSEGRSRNQLIAAVLHDHFKLSDGDLIRAEASSSIGPSGNSRLMPSNGRSERP